MMVTRFDFQNALMKALGLEGRRVVSVKLETDAVENSKLTLVLDPSDAELQEIIDAIGEYREAIQLEVSNAPINLGMRPPSRTTIPNPSVGVTDK